MLAELHQKGGRLCEPARSGQLHCPLLIRPTSEDVITAHVVETLRIVNPRHWVSDLLSLALGRPFRRQVFRKFRIEPWVSKPRYPTHLLPWDEGSTQVDIQVSWENPATTIYIEAKYGSDLSKSVSGDDGRSGYPSDQLIRNVRVGLLDTGHLHEVELFDTPPRNFAVILFSPTKGHPLVARYRNLEVLQSSIPHADRFRWPEEPIVGELDYLGLRSILSSRYRLMTRAERTAAQALEEYLSFKSATRPRIGLKMAD